MTKWMLDDRALLRLSGADVHRLFQGIVTNNMEHLASKPAVFSALLSPQGKFLHDFFLIAQGDDVVLDVDAGRMPDLLKRLTMYRLRADVTFAPMEEWGVYACSQEESLHDAFIDPRLAALGSRWIAPVAEMPDVSAAAREYDAWRLSHGVPEGAKDAIIDRSLALELHYDALNAIDFHKGCYVGQEVTARSKHRGQMRKQMLPVSAQTTLPQSGTPIHTADGKQVGEMRSSRAGQGIALVRLEPWQEALERGQTLHAQEVELQIHMPSWMEAVSS